MEEVKDTMIEDIKDKKEEKYEEDDDLNYYSEDNPPLARVLIKYILFVLVLVVAVILLMWLIWQPGNGETIENSSVANPSASEPNMSELAMQRIGAAGEAVVRWEEYLNELAKQEIEEATESVIAEEIEENTDLGMIFIEVEEVVTAKDVTNLRDIPSQGEDSVVMITLQNGQTATRIGISENGWSKLEYNGEIYYAVSSLLTTDLTVKPQVTEVDDGIQTVFADCNEKVSPKIEVNLRTLPSVTNPDSVVVVTLPYGEVVTRTGINTDVGWSRVEYNGQTLYCISSYIYVVE